MFWWLLSIALTIFLYVKLVTPYYHWKKRNVIYKTPWPLVGNMGPAILRQKPMAEYISDLYNEFDTKYVGVYQFMEPFLMLRDPELIKQIAIKDFDSFLDHREFISDDLEPLFSKNLFSLKGQKWRNMRSILSPAFTGSKMRSMFVLMSETAAQFTNYFLEKSKEENPIKVEMKDIFTRYANDVIATTTFGIQCDSLKQPKNEFYMYGKDASNFGGIKNLIFLAHALCPGLLKIFNIKLFGHEVCNFFRNVVMNTMKVREEQGIVRHDMIHLLMQAKKGQLKHEDGKKDEAAGFATVEESQVGKEEVNISDLTDDDLTAQGVLFFIAGFESISSNMCLLAHELATHPEIQERLQSEIDCAFEENEKMTYDVLMKMKYLDMVISENLRKWPSGILTDRKCTKSYTVQPVGDEEAFVIEKGDVCWIPVFAIHRNPEYYPEPEKFDPERFSEENKHKINPLAYIPFGVGPRNCIGSRFALLEIKTVFVHLLRKFNLIVTEKTDIPVRLNKGNFNLGSERGFHLGLQPRNI